MERKPLKAMMAVFAWILLFLAIYLAGLGFMTKELALGLFLALIIVAVERSFDFIESLASEH